MLEKALEKITGWRAVIALIVLLVVPALVLNAIGREPEDLLKIGESFESALVPLFCISFVALLLAFYLERRRAGQGIVASLVGVFPDLVAAILEAEKGGKPIIVAPPTAADGKLLSDAEYEHEKWLRLHVGILHKVPEIKTSAVKLFSFVFAVQTSIYYLASAIAFLVVGPEKFHLPVDLDGATVFAIAFILLMSFAMTVWMIRDQRRMSGWLQVVAEERNRLAHEVAMLGGAKNWDITFLDRDEKQ